MRKALIFALVFGLGLAVLFWVDRSRDAGEEERTGPPPSQAPTETADAPAPPAGEPAPIPGEGQEPEVLADVKISGKGDILVFDETTSKKAYRIEAENFVPSGGPLERTYRVLGVTLEIFDAVSGELRSTLRAAEGRFGVTPARQLEDLRIADEGRVELIDVKLVQHVGGPLVPIEVDAPSMEVLLEREVFRSLGDGEVSVRGVGLDGVGRGLELDGRAGKMTLARGGQVAFVMEDESRATFAVPGDGRIEVASVGAAGEGRIEATATGRARLDLGGEPAGSVEANRVHVLGRTLEGRGTSLDSASAEEDVAVTRGRDRFFGEDARVRLDRVGSIEHVIVRDEPRGRLVLLGTDGAEELLELAGAGPLEVEVDPDAPEVARFRFAGPASLSAPGRDVTLDARGVLTGFVDATRREATVAAREEVEFRQGEARAIAENLDALFIAASGDDAAPGVDVDTANQGGVDVTCIGETQVVGREVARGLFTLGARDEVRIRVRGDQWLVPYARGATLYGKDDERIRVTAGVLRDLDEEAGTFVAEEGVTYATASVEGSAQRAVSRGEGGISFYGVANAPARARLDDGREGERATASFEALEIDVNALGSQGPSGLEARGSVRAAVRDGDVDLELSAGSARFATERDPGEGGPFLMEADDVAHLGFAADGMRSRISCAELIVRGTLPDPATGKPDPEAPPTDVLAQGGVRISHEGLHEMTADGERLELQVGGRGRLEGAGGVPVRARGKIPGRELPYELEAEWIEYEKLRLEASAPDLTILGPLLSSPGAAEPSDPQGAGESELRTTLRAEHFRVDATGGHFRGRVRARGTTLDGLPVVLDADNLRIGGVLTEEGMADLASAIRSFEARGNVWLAWGGLGSARGERLRATRERVVIEGTPAVIDAVGHTLESNFIDVDLVNFLIACERGVLRAPESGVWSVEFAAVRPVISPQGTMLALSNPIFQSGRDEARAQFASIWIHEEAWRARGTAMLWGAPAPDPEAPPERGKKKKKKKKKKKRAEPRKGDLVHGLFSSLGKGEMSKLIRTLWLEGDVEATQDGNRVARADEVYLDLEVRNGRLANAELSHELELGSSGQVVRTKAGEILAGSDGSLTAEQATLTTCDHDVPHYVIEVGKLLLIPREDGRWRFGAQENRIAFRGGFQLPLPSLGNVVLDEQGDFVGFENEEGEVRTVDELALKNSARFGTTLGASFSSEIGGFGRKIARFIGFDKDRVQGSWQYDGAWLSSRGPLLGVGLSLTERARKDAERESFWLDLYATGIPDDGPDRGLLRVPEDERDTFRHWVHGRGRYPFSAKSWIDLAFSTQSDPGVQSEFYQSEYQRFEQRDNYLHVRSASDATYADASVEVRVDDYRTEVEELPSAGYYRGSSQVASLGPHSLDYSFAIDADRMRRRPGDSKERDGQRYEEEFRDSFGEPDNLGTREVLRLDNRHRLEVPISTGALGIQVTPHVEGRVTVWDEGVEAADDPRRAALLGGVDVATTLHKRVAEGFLHSLTPSVGLSADLALDTTGGDPVRFDSVDDPLDGEQIELGLRSLWRKLGSSESLDLELRGVRRTDREEGLSDLEQVTVLGELRTTLFARPFALRHDGRYDTTNGETPYSRSSMAIAPTERLEFELGFRRGVPEDRDDIFEAASLDTLFRLDPKWEIELGQQISLSGNDVLKSQAILRRFSHDFLLELSVGHRAGEGTTFGIAFRPLLAYGRSKLSGLSERD